MSARHADAQIITFYSYKGGTGRSMAVANVAWILASSGRRVLVIDWDLEAPGLHRYFRPFLVDPELQSSPGVIDFVVNFASEAVIPKEDDDPRWYYEHADISTYAIALEWQFPDDGFIHFVPAGRQDAAYATRVSTFNWANFYERLGGGALFEATRELLKTNQEYDFVLIDSRTGVSDTAGICTIQLPDTLVVCFTYNNQSTDGAAAVSCAARKQRSAAGNPSSAPRDLRIFPVPMRVDPFESTRLKIRQNYAWQRFDVILDHLPVSPRQYWSEVEVPYVPAFAYEEVLATFRDNAEDPKSVLGAFLRIAAYLAPIPRRFVLVASPEQRDTVLRSFAAADEEVLGGAPVESLNEAAMRIAEATYARVAAESRDDARRLWLSLVRVTEAYEVTDVVGVRTAEEELAHLDLAMIEMFVGAALLQRETGPDGKRYIAPATAGVLQWPRLKEWVNENREFLTWRQRVRGAIEHWQEKGQPKDLLLRGDARREARKWVRARKADLLPAESRYVHASQQLFIGKTISGIAFAAIVLIAVLQDSTRVRESLGRVLPRGWFSSEEGDPRSSVVLSRAVRTTDPLEAALLLAEVKTPPPQAESWMIRLQPALKRPIPHVVLQDERVALSAIAFSPDNRTIVTSSAAGKIGVWSAENGEFRFALQAGPLAYRSDAAAAIANGFRLVTMQPRDEPDPRAFAAFMNDDVIVTSGALGLVRFFDSRSGRAIKSAKTAGFAATPLIATTTKSVVLAGDRTIVSLDQEGGNDFSVTVPAPITDFSVGNDIVAVAAQRPYVVRFGKREQLNDDPVRFIRVSRDGSVIVTAIDQNVRLFKGPAFTAAGTLVHPIQVNAMDIDATGTRVATGGDDGVLRIWKVADGTSTEITTGHDGPITAVAFDSKGGSVATGATDGTVRVWPLDQAPLTFPGFDKMEVFGARTAVCLTAAQRARLLDETSDDAEKRSRDCQQLKRAPSTVGGDF